MVQRDDQPPRALLFDGSPLLASGVFAARDGGLHTGRDAERLSLVEPARFEPYPKRRVDDGTVLLGGSELPTAALLGAVLRRGAQEAWQAGVDATDATVLTHPADWGGQRRGVLKEAARLAGIGKVILVDEPVAAATYCVDVLRHQVPDGRSLVIFDFGGGTLDLAVVRQEPAGLRVLASGGLDDLGGLDVDAALVGHLGQLIALRDPDVWQRLSSSTDTVDLRERAAFWSEVRAAKEMLSRSASAPVQLPRTPEALHLTREELERLARPLVDRAVDETRRLLQRCGLTRADLAGVFLVGGSSRIPLVATRLHARLGVAPTVPEQPELPVAYGALLATVLARPVADGAEDWGAAVSGPAPLSAGPASGVVSGPPMAPGPPGPQPLPPWVPPPAPMRTGARRRGVLLAGILAAVLAVASIGAVWWSRSVGRAGADPTRTATGGQTGGQTGATTGPQRALPAGFVTCGTGLCPSGPTCWGGLTAISGVAQPPGRLDCGEPHYWETYVAAYLPPDAVGVRQDKLLERADIAGICSPATLTARSRNPADTTGWRTEAWPVQVDGAWILYCLAGPGEGGEWTGTRFRSGG
ncbi:MAG: hypothetical protein AUI14_22410 [Actinobacteria bacterium 13_2_20CM_2_71_6]|nr:MAG: hypothetical protein AUI14_22410 [Actinobacteria bacterium 13_2_20CM_2_71_6]